MKTNFVPSIAAVTILASSSVSAGAATTIQFLTSTQPVATNESGWQVRAALYGWGTSLNGDVTLRGNLAPVDVGFDDVLETLDFAAMGAVEISHGKWSFLADLFYAELSSSNARRDLHFSTKIDQFIGNFVITRNVMDEAETHIDVYAGLRVNSLDADLDIQTNQIGTFSGSQSKTWGDPIIGFRFQQELSEKFTSALSVTSVFSA